MNLKPVLLSLLLALAAVTPLHAQTEARVSEAERDAERARITRERDAANKRGLEERVACYKKFAVEDCLADSRRRQRVTLDRLRADEARVNDIGRRERGGKALERLDRKNAPEQADADARKREDALKAQQGRDDRAADRAASRAAAAGQSTDKRESFENKQRAHAERQAKQAEREGRAAAERQQHEDKLRRTQEHNAERERRNAERTKPRAAPLPPAS